MTYGCDMTVDFHTPLTYREERIMSGPRTGTWQPSIQATVPLARGMRRIERKTNGARCVSNNTKETI